jgi:hypothetical protein
MRLVQKDVNVSGDKHMKNRSKFIVAAIFLWIIGWMIPARASVTDLQIGAAAKVVNSVYGVLELAKQTQWLRPGIDVFQNELVVTADNSASRLIFKDTTQLSMGSRAQVKLDRFVFDPNPSASTLAISFVHGVFRFATGLLPKENYAIRTPSADLYVRGTVFTVLITPTGSELISVESGTVYVRCRRTGVNVAVNAGQSTYIPSPNGSPQRPTASPPNPTVAHMDALLR